MHDPSQNQDQTNENLTEPFLPAIAALYRTMSVGPSQRLLQQKITIRKVF